MAKYSKKIMTHHKRNHNGRQRARKGDVPKKSEYTYFRPCGCRPEDVPRRNKSIALAIKSSNPVMEWSSTRGCWVPHISTQIKRQFGRCMRHFDLDPTMKQDTATLAGAAA